jgi:DNA modification methylase
MNNLRNRQLRNILNTYSGGDARQLSRILPSREFIDATITSPPYWNLKDYGVQNQIGFGQSYDSCIRDLTSVFSSIYSITKPTGSLWIIADTVKDEGRLRLFPFDLARELQKVGWVLHDIIVWHKDKTLPWSHRGKLRNIFEYVLFFTKSDKFKYYLTKVREIDDLKRWWVRYPERYSPLGKAPSRTWSIPIPRQGSWGENWVRHYCPLPPELVRRMILLTTDTNDVVFDPFSGSGVVLAQAAAMKRKFVGLDISSKYRGAFRKQVIPSLRKLEAEQARISENGDDKRRQFEKAIWILRKLKVARELQRLYEGEHGRLDAKALLLFSNGSETVTVFVVFPYVARKIRATMLALSQLLPYPPLSKYGLRIEIHGMSQSDIRSSRLVAKFLAGRRELFLYEGGLTHRCVGSVSVASILNFEKGNGAAGECRYAPILSNIEPNTLLKTLH